MSGHDRCREVKEILPAFLDDELPCDVSHRVQEHLNLCPPCAGIARVESGFSTAMRARVGRIQAPATVVEKMERTLRGPGRARRFGASLAAAAAMVAVIAAVYFMTGGASSLTHATGTLVCVECAKHGAPIEIQRRCRLQGHQTGLLCPRTGLWNLVVNDAALAVIGDPARRGETVTVEGRFLPDIRYIDARSIVPQPGT